MKKDNSIYLNHILEAINNIEEYIKNCPSQEVFASDNKTRDAVLRSFQVIGEAARHLDEEFYFVSSRNCVETGYWHEKFYNP